jgi:hypothetical protein
MGPIGSVSYIVSMFFDYATVVSAGARHFSRTELLRLVSLLL